MSPLVTIGIPAWERPALLLEAVQSCLAQTYSEFEILITDDSRSDAVERALRDSDLIAHARIRYERNETRLGQAGNVNKLAEHARGERLVLLHDDDLLLPEAVEVLDRCWQMHPQLVASYGKSYVITHSGTLLEGKSVACSRSAFRTAEYAGLQKSALWAVLAFQFPLDAFMVRTSAVRATLLKPYAEVGDSCDIDFAVRLAQLAGGFFFVDRYVSKYRITNVSISTESVSDPRYTLVRDLIIPEELESVRQMYLKNIASAAFRRHLLAGERALACKMLRPTTKTWRIALAAARPSNLLLLVMPVRAIRLLHLVRYTMRALLRRRNAVYRGQNILQHVLQHRHRKRARTGWAANTPPCEADALRIKNNTYAMKHEVTRTGKT